EPSRPKLRGFSMVELVLVISIMLIVAGMAVPRFANSLTRNRVEAAAQRVVADLSLAQRHARLASVPQSVVFDPASSSYRLSGLPDPDHPGLEYVVQLGAAPYEATLPKINLGNDSSITFDAYGVPNKSGSVLVQCGEFVRVISVDAAGRATVTGGAASGPVVNDAADLGGEETAPPGPGTSGKSLPEQAAAAAQENSFLGSGG
ncbi:MAG: prepilin-type N-terminal cleavage/methylation domain-containing protein, partial [Phycisphaerae bacterium]|nr:prepilin-type N-terminal cleavage/methylation domain-containing protein [Phycisphaerae bacterium]